MQLSKLLAEQDSIMAEINYLSKQIAKYTVESHWTLEIGYEDYCKRKVKMLNKLLAIYKHQMYKVIKRIGKLNEQEELPELGGDENGDW